MRVSDSKNSVVYRGERVLAYLVAATIALSIVSFLAVVLAPLFGVRNYDEGIWPIILLLPLFGLPLGVALIITLLVTSGVRRSREARKNR